MIEGVQKLDIVEMQKELQGYKANMKIFIQKVEEEVVNLIQNYQIQISNLIKQNENLKRQISGDRIHQCDIFLKSDGFEPVSPIKKTASKIHQEMSTMYITPQKFPNIKPMFSLKNNFSINSNFDDLSKSRFQVEKNRNKQRQQELLQSLESGRNNLEFNTSKIFQILGKQKKIESQDEQIDEQQMTQSARNKSDPLNTSLSSICSSLDNSFYAKRSRQKNDKKRQRQQKQRNEKLERLKESQKMRKQQGLKNLLKTMRDNVNASGNKPIEIVNNSKLLTTGNENPNQLKSKPKVMINPVPVDISKRNRNNTSLSSPKSILKQPSTILTKSLMMGNSAISFQC